MKTLVSVPKYFTNGWLIIAPTPQKKFRIFKAEVCRAGFNSAVSIFMEGRVVPIPIPFTKNPKKQISIDGELTRMQAIDIVNNPKMIVLTNPNFLSV